MSQLAVRLPKSMLARLDAVCAERGLTRSQLVRQVLVPALEGAQVEPVDVPSKDDLLELLAERGRAGNVAAIRSLLARTDETDPRDRALEALRALAEERQPCAELAHGHPSAP